MYQDTLGIVNKILEFHGDKTFDQVFLKKYLINPNKIIIEKLMKELKIAGIGSSTLFPDLDGLAKELKFQFKGAE